MNYRVAVLGPGSWGTALAQVLAENGHDVRIWGHRASQVEEINTQHTNQRYLPDHHLPDSIRAFTDMEDAVKDADAVLFVIPTKAIRSVAKELVAKLNTKPVIIHASKGLEQGTHKRISEILLEEIPTEKRKAVAVLSGPSHAEEVAKHDITTITAASTDVKAAKYVQELFMNHYFRIYTNPDVIGVAMGANPLTFIGLSGVGDLVVTCTSVHSRNWRAGNLLGQGQPLEEVLANMGMVVEGVNTTQAAMELAQMMEIEMPITQTIYEVLYEQKEIKTAAKEIMLRDGKKENEFSLTIF